MGNRPSRLETRLQTIQFFPYHAGLATPHRTRFRVSIALSAGSCPHCFSTLGKLLTQEHSSSSSWLYQGCCIVRHGAPSRLVGDPEVHSFPWSVRRFVVRRLAWSLQVPLGRALTVRLPLSSSSQTEVIAPSSSDRRTTMSHLTLAQSRANHRRSSLHSLLGAGASLTALSIHAPVPFGFHLQVRKCFIHFCSSEAGLLQQGKRMRIGARQLT